jgi:23S rRNA (uracil1939-C5)-methyltransferase
MTAPSKNQDIQIDIERLGYGAEGIGRFGEYEALVYGGLPGDRLTARISRVCDTTVYADIIEILQPSPFRQEPVCPVFSEGCGGCQWLHLTYEKQLEWKKRIVEQLLQTTPRLRDVPVSEVVGMNNPYHYRNKMVVRTRGPADSLRVGFQDRYSWVLDVFNNPEGQCYIQSPLNNRVGRALAEALARDRRPLKSATVRVSDEDEITLDLERKLASSITADLEGVGHIGSRAHYTIHGRRFQVTSPAFFQANTRQTQRLVDTVLGCLPEERLRTAVDVYCGVGLFALFLAERSGTVYGIEESHTAIEDALINGQGIDNIRFIKEKAETALPRILREAGDVDLILVDPPRSGCAETALGAIADCHPKMLIYVSCNVKSLIRDMEILHARGLVPVEVTPVDMFPHTYHIECVVKCAGQTGV